MNGEITITLPVREAQALANAGGMLCGILEELPSMVHDRGPRPLESALMRLECALVVAGVGA